MGNLENALHFMLTISFGKTVPLSGEVSYVLPVTSKDAVLYSTVQTVSNTKYKQAQGDLIQDDRGNVLVRNMEALSCNHFCRKKKIIVRYSDSVCL